MREGDQIRLLPATGRAAAERTQTTKADTNDLAQTVRWKAANVFFDELKPHGFWLAKNTFVHCPRTNGGKRSHPFLEFPFPP